MVVQGSASTCFIPKEMRLVALLASRTITSTESPTFTSFETAIRGRNERREKAETTLIGFEASDISAAELRGTQASVTVRFVSEQINVVRNADSQIIDGNPNEVQKVVDLWAFRRDTKSGDPNWQLVKTESEG